MSPETRLKLCDVAQRLREKANARLDAGRHSDNPLGGIADLGAAYALGDIIDVLIEVLENRL